MRVLDLRATAKDWSNEEASGIQGSAGEDFQGAGYQHEGSGSNISLPYPEGWTEGETVEPKIVAGKIVVFESSAVTVKLRAIV